MPIWYNYFCDESAVHGRPTFYIGGLRATPNRALRFSERLERYKRRRRVTHELKWSKVNRTFLSLYAGWINEFVEESASVFHVLRIDKKTNWKSFGSTEEERFFKSYYIFFRWFCAHDMRFDLTLDYKPTKWYRWQSLQFALNGSLKRDYGWHLKPFRSITPRNSKNEALLQLTDVLLGGISFQGEAGSAKSELAMFIRSLTSSQTKYGTPLVQIKAFSPRALS
jgi:hypothetical protein